MKTITRHRYINKIPVLEVVPEEQKHQALPIIIYYHGWQSSKELSMTQARKLAKRGIRVVLPDAMNHGERRTGPISPIPSITFWSSIQYNLIEFSEILYFFQKLNLVDGDKIGVGGVSMGGMTTSALLTQHPEIKVAACLMGTPKPMHYIDLVIETAAAHQMRVPQDLRLLLSWVKNYDLSQQSEKIANRPVLFWHGTADPKIPYQDVADFYQQVKDKPYANQVEFWTGEGEGHLVKGELMDQVVDFFTMELLEDAGKDD